MLVQGAESAAHNSMLMRTAITMPRTGLDDVSANGTVDRLAAG